MTSALWVWPSLFDDDAPFELTENHISAIRRLVAYWSVTEHGAAMLARDDFTELEDFDEDNAEEGALLDAVDIFLTHATVDRWSGEIRSPYAAAAEFGWLLSDAPEIDALEGFQSGATVSFTATEEELTLWREANFRSAGIDPKRPFGSGMASRDIRRLIDPEKKLSSPKFKRRSAHLQTRLILLLQFFVQNASIKPGHFQRLGGAQWRKVDPEQAPAGELIDLCEWRNRITAAFASESGDYAATVQCLSHLAWENRINDRYPGHVARFKLDDYYLRRMHSDYQGACLEHIAAGLNLFARESCACCYDDLSLMYCRVLNAHGRHDEALSQLGAFSPSAGDNVLWTTDDDATLILLERLVASYGAEKMSFDEFQAVLAGTHSGWAQASSRLWDFVWSVLNETDDDGPPHRAGRRYHAMRAVCAQLSLMRGAYDADYEVKRY